MFASFNVCRGESLSRRDDIESFLYMLVYLLSGESLPWSQLQMSCLKNHLTLEDAMLHRSDKDMELKAEECMPTPRFREYYRSVRALKFDERPDYDALQKLLELESRQQKISLIRVSSVANHFTYSEPVDCIDLENMYKDEKLVVEELSQGQESD